MNLSKLAGNDRTVLVAGIIVAVTALISLVNNWGVFMVLSMFAGLAAAYIVLQPQIAPAMKMPAPRALSLLAAGGVATIASGLTAIDWLSWILEHLISFDTIQFIAGLIAAIVVLWVGWTEYSGARGTAAPAAPPPA